MANNVFGGRPNAVVAKQTIDFATAGLNNTNIEIIYECGNALKSWVPGRPINAISGFTDQQGYYMVPKIDMDLSAYVVPPISDSGGGGGDVYTDIDFPTVNNIHATSHIWTPITATGDYGNTGLSGVKLPSGVDGSIIMQLVDNEACNAVLGFASTNALTGYASMKAAVWRSKTGGVVATDVAYNDNGTINTIGSVSNGNWVGIFRTGSTLKIRKSPDKTTWTDVYTFSYTSSADLFVVCDIDGTTPDVSKLATPQQTGLS